MAALSEYTNVYNTALLVLKHKGYRLWYDDDTNCFCAEKGGWDFMSESPCGLLGLISIFEFQRPNEWHEYWWRQEGPNLYSELPHTPPPYEPVAQAARKR